MFKYISVIFLLLPNLHANADDSVFQKYAEKYCSYKSFNRLTLHEDSLGESMYATMDYKNGKYYYKTSGNLVDYAVFTSIKLASDDRESEESSEYFSFLDDDLSEDFFYQALRSNYYIIHKGKFTCNIEYDNKYKPIYAFINTSDVSGNIIAYYDTVLPGREPGDFNTTIQGIEYNWGDRSTLKTQAIIYQGKRRNIVSTDLTTEHSRKAAVQVKKKQKIAAVRRKNDDFLVNYNKHCASKPISQLESVKLWNGEGREIDYNEAGDRHIYKGTNVFVNNAKLYKSTGYLELGNDKSEYGIIHDGNTTCIVKLKSEDQKTLWQVVIFIYEKNSDGLPTAIKGGIHYKWAHGSLEKRVTLTPEDLNTYEFDED